MRFLSFAAFAFAVASTACAASIETFTGDILTGKVELDFGGIFYHPPSGPTAKIDLGSVYRVEFNLTGSIETFKPGVVLPEMLSSF